MVQWLGLCAPNAGGPGSIPGRGTRSHMLQLKILHAATKTWHSQVNKYIFFLMENILQNTCCQNMSVILKKILSIGDYIGRQIYILRLELQMATLFLVGN